MVTGSTPVDQSSHIQSSLLCSEARCRSLRLPWQGERSGGDSLRVAGDGEELLGGQGGLATQPASGGGRGRGLPSATLLSPPLSHVSGSNAAAARNGAAVGGGPLWGRLGHPPQLQAISFARSAVRVWCEVTCQSPWTMDRFRKGEGEPIPGLCGPRVGVKRNSLARQPLMNGNTLHRR